MSTSVRVDTVTDGEVSLQFIRRHRYDLLLVDLMMPVLDGAGLIERVRTENLAQGVPIAVFSADSRAREKGLSLGADLAMRKPINLDELLAVVQRLVHGLK